LSVLKVFTDPCDEILVVVDQENVEHGKLIFLICAIFKKLELSFSTRFDCEFIRYFISEARPVFGTMTLNVSSLC
jgi:hypothetical protein